MWPYTGRLLKPPLAAFLFLVLVAVGGHSLLSTGASAQGVLPGFLVLGDSIGFGRGATDTAAGGYAALTYGALRDSERYRATGLDFINLSVPGATSADLLEPGGQLDEGLQRIEDRAGSGGEVEIIAVDIGGNDLLNLAQQGSACLRDLLGQECIQALGEALGGLQRNLSEALSKLREAAPKAIMVALDLYNPYSGTANPVEPIATAAVQQFNGIIAAAAADPDLHVRTASVYQLFQGRGKQWVANDGIHPNDNGHKVIAEVVVATIDGRDAQIPEGLLAVPTDAPAEGSTVPLPGSGNDSGIAVWVLIAAVAASFVAGALVSGAYFVARGRV
jgi:lysophospholipase L1-like esterase